MRLGGSKRATLVLGLWAAACQRPGVSPEVPDAAAAETKARVGDVDPPKPAAEPTHPLELVPARARAMIMARSPQRLAQAWGRDRFMGQYRAHYETLVTDMRMATGHDLLDPSGLAAIGIDPTAPVGIAVLSFEDEAFVAFGGCSNPTALVELLRRVSGKPLEPEVVGQAQLVRVDEEVSLVLRNGMFALVLVDRAPQGGPDHAREVARIDPAQSLAHAMVMERAHAGLPQQADVRAMLDVAGIVRDEMEQSRRFDRERVGQAERQLAEARQRGASAGEIASLQSFVQEEQQSMARRQRERQVGELLLSRTLGAIEGIGLAVDADDHGLRGRIHVALPADAAFRPLFVASERPPAAIVALGDAPQLVLSSQLDVGLAIDLFAQATLAAGTSYGELNDELKRELGLDFDRTLRPLLDGRATFVMTAGPTLDPARATEVADTLGGLLALGVNDEAKAHAVLEAVVATRADARVAPTPEISGFTLTRTDAPKAVHLGVVGGHLVVGTDLAALRRLRDGQAGPAGGRFSDPEPWQRLTEGPGEGRLALHHRLPLSSMFWLFGSFDAFNFPHNPDNELAGEFPEVDVFSIPRSPATARLEKQRDAAFKARYDLEERARNQRQVLAWNRADALGLTAGVVREVETGLVIEGGHYVKGGVPGYVDAIVSLVETFEGSEADDPALARARQRQEKLDARLLEARRKDVQRELARRKGSSG